MGTLYIVRHSITGLNSSTDTPQEKIRGWLDVPLNDDGWELAQKTAQVLRNKNILKIFSSDLKRAIQTSEVISQITDIPITTSKLFRPWDVGGLEGHNAKLGIPIMKWLVKHPDRPVKEGESYKTFYNRWKKGLTYILAAVSKLPEGQALCLVTHSRNIYCLENILSGGKAPIKFDDVVTPSGILEVSIEKNYIKVIYNPKV